MKFVLEHASQIKEKVKSFPTIEHLIIKVSASYVVNKDDDL